MSSVVTIRVRPPAGADRPEAHERIQASASAELSRVRASFIRKNRTAIESVLVDRLERVTGGRVVQSDLPLAAHAVQRGQYIVVQVTDHPGTDVDSAEPE